MRDGLGGTRSLLVLGGDSDIGNATAKALIARAHARGAARRPQPRPAGGARQGAARGGRHAGGGRGLRCRRRGFPRGVFRRRRSRASSASMSCCSRSACWATRRRRSATRRRRSRVARTNYLGAASVAVHAAERLRRQGQGTLVVLSRWRRSGPRRSNFVYGSTKAGLDALCRGPRVRARARGRAGADRAPRLRGHEDDCGAQARAVFDHAGERSAAAIVKAIARGDELIWTPGKLRYVMMVMKLVPRPIFRRLKL